MKTRFFFNVWGRQVCDLKYPEYAMVEHWTIDPALAIAKCIARANKLLVASLDKEGIILPEGFPNYDLCLRRPYRSSTTDDAIVAQVWFCFNPDQGSRVWRRERRIHQEWVARNMALYRDLNGD